MMGFMNSYKRLDNLCRDMNGVGITNYIKDMENALDGAFYVSGWQDDYLKLKKYRYIRNQIAHENYANESNMCSDADATWLENFYQRIMIQDDPIALYYKATRNQNKNPNQISSPKKYQYTTNLPTPPTKENPGNQSIGCTVFILFAIGVGALILVAALFM